MYNRTESILSKLCEDNWFVFGPRQTGKSTFLRQSFPQALYVDLLNSKQFRELGTEPSSLQSQIQAHLSKSEATPLVIIDEIQKLPSLLDAVQESMALSPNLRFLLTGSSPRKLRRAGTNLLGGRALWMNFHGLTTQEAITWKEQGHSWQTLLLHGGLPSVLLAGNRRRKLRAYIDLYLQEEVAQEALVRNLPQFSRFLHFAGQTSGQQIVFEKVGSDCAMKGKTVRDWYDILQDTLLGKFVPCFTATHKRKAVSTSKFYLFDVGVANYLKGISELEEGTKPWGDALEHLVYTELVAAIDYSDSEETISYWRSTSGAEVDFVVHRGDEPTCFIEVKARTTLTSHDLAGIRALSEEFNGVPKYIVTRGAGARLTDDGIWILPVEEFFHRLWDGKIVQG
jgi:predicted AAA+ superfamily ATPase